MEDINMSVHKEISKHSQKQHAIVKEFLKLDQEREYHIDVAIQKCSQNEPFSVDRINEVTKRINELPAIAEERKLITKEMVQEYVSRKK